MCVRSPGRSARQALSQGWVPGVAGWSVREPAPRIRALVPGASRQVGHEVQWAGSQRSAEGDQHGYWNVVSAVLVVRDRGLGDIRLPGQHFLRQAKCGAPISKAFADFAMKS